MLLLLMGSVTACSSLGPYRGPVSTGVEPEPAVEPVASPVTEPPAKPPEAAPTIAEPAPITPPPRPRPRVLVVRSSDADSYRDVAGQLEEVLAGRYELEQANLDDKETRAGILAAGPAGWDAAVAIGMDAADFAGTDLGLQTVFCQVFEYEPLLERHQELFGVDALPPLDLQLQAWKRISNNASTVGIILDEHDTERLAAARRAAADAGVELRLAFAATDRDALYQFKRFAQSVDGIWLLPNGSIFSPHVLREILDYARDHGVQSIVFNDALLSWGALLSVGSDASDVAATVSRVLGQLLDGNAAELDRVTSLTRVDVQVNESVASALGLASVPVLASDEKRTTGRAHGR